MFRLTLNPWLSLRVRLAEGISSYHRRSPKTWLRLRLALFQASWDCYNSGSDPSTLSSRHLLSTVKVLPFELASTRLLLRAVPQGNSVARPLSLGPRFTPLRRLPRIISQHGAWSGKLHFFSADSETTIYAGRTERKVCSLYRSPVEQEFFFVPRVHFCTSSGSSWA